MFSSQILNRLWDWIEQAMALSQKRAGSRRKVSTTDLIKWRSIDLEKGRLFVAFMDLWSAFDLVWRTKLWETLSRIGVPIDLLTLIQALYTGNFARVSWGLTGKSTDEIPVRRGMGQGCVFGSYTLSPIHWWVSPISLIARTIHLRLKIQRHHAWYLLIILCYCRKVHGAFLHCLRDFPYIVGTMG